MQMSLTSGSILQDRFQLEDFRLGQKQIIDAILDKKDVLAVLPTGGGKSLCYQYPALATNQLVIVVSPLIALMRDQVAALKAKGIPAGCIHSGQTDHEKMEVFNEIENNQAYVLYLSPERVQKSGYASWIKKRPIALFAIDEAHCVSQWGHDFREEYSKLSLLKQLRPDVPILALTASATPLVLNDIAANLKLNQPERMVHGFYRPNLYYQVEACNSASEKLNLLISGIQQNPDGRILIYCGTRRSTRDLADILSTKFKNVGYYHAGLSSQSRNKIQEKYISGKLRILVATNAFGMGIDQPDVRFVVHYQLPANIDSLYQEMGRAGRDNKHSTCLMLYAKKDKALQSFFIQSSDAPYKIKELRYKNLDTLIAYADGSECRHGEILTYYKDSQRIPKCGHCDNCDPQSLRKIIPSDSILMSAKDIPSSLGTGRSKKTKTRKSNAPIFLNAEQEQLLLKLKAWRKAKAEQLDLPAFVVFSDKTLRDLVSKHPKDLEGLKEVHGIGEQKVEKFGWDLLAELS